MLSQFMGHKIVEDRYGLCHTPKIKVSDSFEWITDIARQEMNDWLRDMFGEKCNIMKFGDTLVLCEHAMQEVRQHKANNSFGWDAFYGSRPKL